MIAGALLREFVMSNFQKVPVYERLGTVVRIDSSSIRIKLPACFVGLRLEIERVESLSVPLLAEVVAIEESLCVASPLGNVEGIQIGATVRPVEQRAHLDLSPKLLGCAIGSGGGVFRRFASASQRFSGIPPQYGRGLSNAAPPALDRKRIREIFPTGIRAIDAFVTLGLGQRIGIFAEPGVGKTSLLGSLIHSADCDVVVIALVGERGREVGDFLEDTLSEPSREKSVVVFSTSEEPALARVHAALLALTIAEYFRDSSLNVLFLVDSLTRLCRAYREIGLLSGEAPVRKGYPASIFSRLPEFIERAGCGQRGSITALYTVLLSGDLDEDPIVEEIKSLTDGHIVLSKDLAEKGQYPAIDVVRSLSRLAKQLVDPQLSEAAVLARRLLSRLDKEKEMLMFGGSPDEELGNALRLEKDFFEFLKQRQGESSPFQETQSRLITLLSESRQ